MSKALPMRDTQRPFFLALRRGGLALAALGLSCGVQSRDITVGPQGEFLRVDQAARAARDGDTVLIAPGDYRGDVVVWTQRRLSIRGSNPRPTLHADGKIAEGKAIWVIRNGDVDISNIEFHGARAPDGNGAAIRLEAGRLSIANCEFRNNQMGVLTGNLPKTELVIENSLFADAPRQAGTLPHLLYAGAISSLKVSGSRFHTGYRGHLIKSRARVTELRYNLIVDGILGEASYEIDLPNGGDALLVGNVIGQSVDTQNPVMLAYGAEGQRWESNRLRLSHNTFFNQTAIPAWFVRVWEQKFAVRPTVDYYNNLFAGLGLFDFGVLGQGRGNHLVPTWGLANSSALDFRLGADSWLKNRAVALPEELSPSAEFGLPHRAVPIAPRAIGSPGAYPSVSAEQ